MLRTRSARATKRRERRAESRALRALARRPRRRAREYDGEARRGLAVAKAREPRGGRSVGRRSGRGRHERCPLVEGPRSPPDAPTKTRSGDIRGRSGCRRSTARGCEAPGSRSDHRRPMARRVSGACGRAQAETSFRGALRALQDRAGARGSSRRLRARRARESRTGRGPNRRTRSASSARVYRESGAPLPGTAGIR